MVSKKIDEVKDHHKQLRERENAKHDKIYHKALNLSTLFGSNGKKLACVIRGRRTRPNPTVSSPSDYWGITNTIPLLDSIISELEARFSINKRAHYELCVR